MHRGPSCATRRAWGRRDCPRALCAPPRPPFPPAATTCGPSRRDAPDVLDAVAFEPAPPSPHALVGRPTPSSNLVRRGTAFWVALVSLVAAGVWSVAAPSRAQEGGYIGVPRGGTGPGGVGAPLPGGAGTGPTGVGGGYAGVPGGPPDGTEGTYAGVPGGGPGGTDAGAAGSATPGEQARAVPRDETSADLRGQDNPGGRSSPSAGTELLQFVFIAAGFAALYLMIARNARKR